jgi:hypothetical protein
MSVWFIALDIWMNLSLMIYVFLPPSIEDIMWTTFRNSLYWLLIVLDIGDIDLQAFINQWIIRKDVMPVYLLSFSFSQRFPCFLRTFFNKNMACGFCSNRLINATHTNSERTEALTQVRFSARRPSTLTDVSVLFPPGTYNRSTLN